MEYSSKKRSQVIKIKDVKLKIVTKSDHSFLYELLKQRDSIVNISHKKMPSYKDHVKFILSKPYSKWYVIQYDDQRVGSIYLSKQNEIGIFLINEMSGKSVGSKALKLLMEKNSKLRYLANINPKNKDSVKFFKKMGFNMIQHTYELVNTEYDKKN
jgi:predicted acetyltransferase